MLQGEPIEELVEVPIDSALPNRTIRIGPILPKGLKGQLMTFLRENKDGSAWTDEEIPRIDPAMRVHRLNVDSIMKVIEEKRWSFAPEKN